MSAPPRILRIEAALELLTPDDRKASDVVMAKHGAEALSYYLSTVTEEVDEAAAAKFQEMKAERDLEGHVICVRPHRRSVWEMVKALFMQPNIDPQPVPASQPARLTDDRRREVVVLAHFVRVEYGMWGYRLHVDNLGAWNVWLAHRSRDHQTKLFPDAGDPPDFAVRQPWDTIRLPYKENDSKVGMLTKLYGAEYGIWVGQQLNLAASVEAKQFLERFMNTGAADAS